MPRLIARVLIAGMAAAAVAAPGMAQVDSWTVETITSKEDQAATNNEQAEIARQALQATQKAHEQAMQAYEKALEDRETQIRTRQEEYEAELARRAREHEEAMERWRADVEACKSGDKSRCASK